MISHSSIMDEFLNVCCNSFAIKGSFIVKEFKMLSPFYNSSFQLKYYLTINLNIMPELLDFPLSIQRVITKMMNHNNQIFLFKIFRLYFHFVRLFFLIVEMECEPQFFHWTFCLLENCHSLIVIATCEMRSITYIYIYNIIMWKISGYSYF